MKNLKNYLINENKIKNVNKYKEVLTNFLHDKSFKDDMFKISVENFKEGEAIVIKFSNKFADLKIWKLCADIERALLDNSLDFEFVGSSSDNEKIAILPYE